MNTTMLRCLLLLSALLLAHSQPAGAAQSYDNCTGFITSIPAVISTQGTWCMKQDLATAMTSGNAITIAANNVTIDCNDYKLGGLAAGPSSLAIGIAAIDRLNGTVRHCNVRGFYVGLYLIQSAPASSSGGYLIEDNRFDGNLSIAALVEGDGSVIRRNRIFDTGNSSGGGVVFALATSYSTDVSDNIVSGVIVKTGSNGSAIGIAIQSAPYGRVVGNGVYGLQPDGSGGGYGIYAVYLAPARLAIHDNDLVGDGGSGIGLDCVSATNRARNNTISAFGTGISTCSDDGGNIIAP